MKKIYSFLLMAAVAVGAMADEFVTDGAGNVYTFNGLSQIENSGVTLAEDGSYIVTADFTIAAGDTLRLMNNDVIKMTENACISIDGFADFTPADTALITRYNEEQPKGFRIFADDACAVLKNVRFEYVGINFGCANGNLQADNCTFTLHNGKSSSTGAIAFSVSSDGNIIENCYFLENQYNAIGCGALNPVGVIIRNNYFWHNTTDNRNKPQLNLTCAGDYDMYVTGNTIIGGQYTMVGGIGVSNMMGMAFTGTLYIEDNYVTENRYGFGMTGPMNAVIKNNKFIDNCYETNPNNGGSCISLYDASGRGNVYIEGNLLEGGLWGITVIGNPTVNAGKVEDPAAEDYNPGNNVFVNNGNSGVLYDFYNNGTSTIYAQGNTWNVTEQTAELIETVIVHKADFDNLGEVIYMPAHQEDTNIAEVATDNQTDGLYYNMMGMPCQAPTAPGIYIHNGKKVLVK